MHPASRPLHRSGRLAPGAQVSNTIYEKPKKDEEAIARIKEVEQRRMQIKLLKLFDEIDADGSGRLSREERPSLARAGRDCIFGHQGAWCHSGSRSEMWWSTTW